MTEPMLIYIAGPYSAATEGGRLDNAHRAMGAGYEVLQRGHYPHIPHLTHFFDIRLGEPALPYETYMAWDDTILQRCDALLYLGPSPGADREKARAEAMGLPVYLSVEEIPRRGEEEWRWRT